MTSSLPTASGLASLLKKYGIKPDQHRDDPNTPRYRGYLVADFQDAWKRYLPDAKEVVKPVTAEGQIVPVAALMCWGYGL